MNSKLTHFIALLIILLPTVVFAQGVPTTYRPLVGIPGVDDVGDINAYINALYALSISIAALLAVIKIIIAGVKWMLSDVVTDKSEAKKDIWNATIGLLIVIAAVLILGVINPQLTSTSVFVKDLENQENPNMPQAGDPPRTYGVEAVMNSAEGQHRCENNPNYVGTYDPGGQTHNQPLGQSSCIISDGLVADGGGHYDERKPTYECKEATNTKNQETGRTEATYDCAEAVTSCENANGLPRETYALNVGDEPQVIPNTVTCHQKSYLCDESQGNVVTDNGLEVVALNYSCNSYVQKCVDHTRRIPGVDSTGTIELGVVTCEVPGGPPTGQ